MKFKINQVVYFIASYSGKITIETMKISKIEAGTIKNYIFYSGTCEEDLDGIPRTECQDVLHDSYSKALDEIARQLEGLKNEKI